MPAQTPQLGVPYPVPDDPLVDYPATGLELAERIEALAAPGWSYRNTNIVTAAASFAASGALMPNNINIDADGATIYLMRFTASAWTNDVVNASNILSGSLDDTELGFLAFHTQPTPNLYHACVGALIFTPAAGPHAVNIRPWIGAGQMTILGGPGGPGAQGPMLLTVEPLRPLGALLLADNVLPPADVELELA